MYLCVLCTQNHSQFGVFCTHVLSKNVIMGIKSYPLPSNLYVYLLLQGPRFFRDSSQLLNTLTDFTAASLFEIKMEPQSCYLKRNSSVALVRERTIPTERPPPVGEVSANFLRIEGCHVVNATDPHGR